MYYKQEVTHDVHYENYRSQKLASKGASAAASVGPQIAIPETRMMLTRPRSRYSSVRDKVRACIHSKCLHPAALGQFGRFYTCFF